MERMSQDDLDQRILTILQKNGKLTNEEIGNMLDRSPSTIRDRIKKMEDERTIMGYSAIVNEGRVGINSDVFVSANIAPDKEGEAISQLLSIENISEVLHTTGEQRIMFRLSAESNADVLNIIDRKVRPLGFDDLTIIYILDHVVRNPGV
jgi:Lrp/AsnC family transcriptional regulator, leucine-responsive regulatory protein